MLKKTLLFLLITSCTAQYDCEELSMKKYKGFPSAAHKFDKHCLDQNVKYTAKLCQKALVDLVVFQNKQKLSNKYGKEILGCFTEQDFKRFVR